MQTVQETQKSTVQVQFLEVADLGSTSRLRGWRRYRVFWALFVPFLRTPSVDESAHFSALEHSQL